MILVWKACKVEGTNYVGASFSHGNTSIQYTTASTSLYLRIQDNAWTKSQLSVIFPNFNLICYEPFGQDELFFNRPTWYYDIINIDLSAFHK